MPTQNFAGRIWVKLIFAAVLLSALYLLDRSGWVDTLRSFLATDELTLDVGDMHINPYIVLKTVLTVAGVFYFVAIIIDVLSGRIARIERFDNSTQTLLQKVTQVGLYILAALISLNVLKIDLAALAVIGGAVGIGLGFGLQKIASNFISGLIILLEKSVRVGDIVELDNGVTGTVRHIYARYTRLEAFDGREIMVPNEDLIAYRLTNLTYTNNRGRLSFRIGVSYDSDLALARSLILEAAHENPRVLNEPQPDIWLEEFADNAVVFHMRAWIEDITVDRYGPVDQIHFAIWHKFTANDIGIPYPQRVIHVKNEMAIPIDG